MRQGLQWWNVALVLTLALGAAAGLVRAAAAAEERATSIRDCGMLAGPAWNQAGEAGDRWRFIATSSVPCSRGPSFVGLLGPRIVSAGTVDVSRFTTPDGWSCLAGRSLALGLCQSRSGGESRVVFVVPDSRGGAALAGAIVGGRANDVVGPLLGGSAGSGGALDLDDEPGALRPTACTPRPGSVWSRSAPQGNLWLVYAGGGITCLAAQGWVIDVSARLPAGTTPAEFDGGDGWRCIAGPNAARPGQRVGACARTRNWRTSLEPRFAVIAGGVAGTVRSRLLTYGYDAALWEIAGAAPASFSRPSTCSFKGITWRVGTRSGDRWLVGAAGGYPCAVASSAATKLLGRTQSATSDLTAGKGVRDAWRCRFTATTRTTTCTWGGAPVATKRRALKLVYTPDRAGGRAIVDAALAG